ncbi:Peptidoglycan/LPS O-acetylase OafA/YrhL, contains acyltransferase and SGNH-hydrolase domains [Pseudarthrobacter equi]|uniref:Peptidoglycan/LPS O-acetylase OafA/YrhL, contains acyltransferase and SGNH-hydrolase domains n=1 Tax=Pseudarthrobacter equi TaxID=728066 RepID=A0A1H1ZW52_9MICC|nr:acyltransferase [Pseudarthrobacter equi]SDT38021.1 Peptidoglycan/LPS O-acetylase OafA/YrhL, contains acyltransferase and SGNH-hydrolase domains [Pseudarthrobacter equi]
MLGTSFAEGKNSLNVIRLILAAAVILSHSWWLGGYGPEPQPGGLKLGSWAVLGFFGISGYLITRSRVRAARPMDYARGRLFRIFPGLTLCVAVVAFIFAPLTAAARGNVYSLRDGLLYFVTNLSVGTPGIALPGIPGSLDGMRDPGSWNGPLWTLFWEVVCYALVGVVLGVLNTNLGRIALLVPFVAGSAFVFTLDAGWGPVPTPQDWPLVPILTFLAGSLVYLFQDKLPVNRVLLVGAAAGVVVAAGSGFAASLVHIPLSVLLIAGSLHFPMSSLAPRSDLSFGIYIYGWPVQQMLAAAEFEAHVPPVVFAMASLAVVAPVAWLSWRWVEGPALRWSRARNCRRQVSQLA